MANGFLPQAQGHQPQTGFEGVPNMFGQNILGMLMQMGGQGILANMMGGMGMSPMGVSDTNVLDRMKHARFTRQHEEFVRTQAEHDRPGYIQMARGVAAATGTNWGGEQHAAANSLASGAVAMSPMLAQTFPNQMDAFSGERGSSAVMAHYMSLGAKHRIDPDTGRFGMSHDNMKDMMDNVYKDMFEGDNYLNQELSAGSAGQLFQELQMRGIMPGAASLEQLDRGTPVDRMRELAGHAEVEWQPMDSMSPEDRDKLMESPEVRAELKQFDSKKVSSSLKEWGVAIEAMKEIFGDAGYPNAPMPMLINALDQLTGGGMQQLDPSQINDLVRTTFNLAQSSGIGMEAANMLTAQAAQQAAAMGLDPVFGARAAQSTMGFTGAYQGMGMGAHQAWGQGDLQEHQEMNTQLVLSAAASQAANQKAATFRLDDISEFKKDTNTYNFLRAVRAGNKEFTFDGEKRSTDMTEDEWIAMVSGDNEDISEGMAATYLQHKAANQEVVFKEQGILASTRAQQGDEFREKYAKIGASSAATLIREDAGLGADVAEKATAEDAEGVSLVGTLGDTALATYMDADAEVVHDKEQRNEVMADAMEDKLRQRAAAGDEAAQAILAEHADPKELKKFLTGMADTMAAETDQYLQDTGQGTLLKQYVQHHSGLQRRTARQQADARVHAMTQTALAPIGKGTMLRRGMEELMTTTRDDKRPLVEILAAGIGGVSGEKIADALNTEVAGPDGEKTNRLAKLRTMYDEMIEAEQEYEKAETPEEIEEAYSLAQERADAYKQEMIDVRKTLSDQGLLYSSMVSRKDTGRVMAHIGYMEKQAEAGEVTTEDARAHMGNMQDTFAKLMGDPVTLKRMGKDTDEVMAKMEEMRESQLEMQVLATDKFDGDLAKAMESDEGRALLKKQRELVGWAHDQMEDPTKAYQYLGKGKREELQGIAARLRGKKQLAGGTIESLLNLDDTQLAARQTKGLLSEAEVEEIKTARGKRDEIGEQYATLSEEWQDESKTIVHDALSAFLGPEGGATVDALMETDEGRRLTKGLTGSGLDSMAMRGYLTEAEKAAKAYHDPASKLGAKEKKAMEEKYGVLLDAFESEDATKSGRVSPEQVMQQLIKKQQEFKDDHTPEEDKTDKVIKMEVLNLHLHKDGSAEGEGQGDVDGTEE